MANNTGFATAPAEGISPDEYQTGSWNFYTGVNVNNQATQQLAAPSVGLAQQSGIKTTVEKPDINVQLDKIHDLNQRDNSYFNVLTGQTGFNSEGVSFDYDTMINKGVGENKKDSVDWAGGFGKLLGTVSPVFSLIGGGEQGFGARLEGPTGKGVFSLGEFSEKALNKHYENFTTSSASYDQMKKEGKTHYNFDTGFAATVGNNHISRAPGQKHFNGLLSTLHSDEHTAFNIAKSMEAIQKGLDPRGSGAFKGYSLTGDNSDNRGGSDAYHPSGMGMITNDGYYTYVDGRSDLGHTKVKLRGGSDSLAILDNLKGKGYNITMTQMLAAMATARAGGASFSEGIKKYKRMGAGISGSAISGVDTSTIAGINKASGSGFTSNIKNVGDNWTYAGEGKGSPMPTTGGSRSYTGPSTVSLRTSYDTNVYESKITPDSIADKFVKPRTVTQEDIRNQDARREEAQKNRKKAEALASTKAILDDVVFQKQRDDTKEDGFIGEYGYNTGGQVSSPIGQLANMLRSNRLGYNTGGRVKGGVYGYQDGGQVNLQEMGFVNGKTPDQVTDAQSVADTEEASVDDGDFIINAPAVEAVGVEPLMDLMMNALNTASEEGVQIVDMPRDTSPDEMVEIFISEGEFVVPRELIPFVEGGIETLEQINALGTDEVSRRAGEGEFNEEAMMEQMSSLEAPPEEIPEPQPMRYGDRVKRIIPSEGFV